MAIIKFPTQKPTEPPFFKDIRKDGYHILSLENQKKPGYYPKELPRYPGVKLSDLKIEDVITIRAFFKVNERKGFRVDGGLIDLRVEFIDEDRVVAAVKTQLPKTFPIETGGSIEVFDDEILYKAGI